jgi:predicted acyl esterase
MIIERDVGIPMDDGVVLRADVFRPEGAGPYPVIMTMGPYGKGVPYRVGYKMQWEWLVSTYPNILPGSSREYMTWETVDPEIWVPWGYVCIRVDCRGAGRSPGFLDIFSPREIRDYYQAIEWAGTQSWSTGKVGLSGISYYAITQWQVASLQPPHLAAMIPWEGAADMYRDIARHGGIQSNGFLQAWYPRQVASVQHGNPNAVLDPWLNEPASGPASDFLSDEELRKNRSDVIHDILIRPLDNEWYRSRSVDWNKVTVPFLSAASWAGFGLHPRGNFEAFTQAASKQKWLECHPGRHEEWFYLDGPMAMQKRFLDHFLKGADNGWDKESPVLLNLRRPFSQEFEVRKESAWPLPRTNWKRIYLEAKDASSHGLTWTAPSKTSAATYVAMEDNLTFYSAPVEHDTEITGPLAAKFFAASSTEDMDLFVTFQAFSPDNREVEFQGTIDPHTPLAQGWLRASHRKLDVAKSLPYRPYHSHDELLPLEPGTVYELDVEIWPTNILLPKGYRLALQISGKDFERPLSANAPNEPWTARGSGPFLHTHPADRPKEIFSGKTTIFTGGKTASYLLLPVIGN